MHDEYLKQSNEHFNLTLAMFLFCLVLGSCISVVWFLASLCSVPLHQRETVHTVAMQLGCHLLFYFLCPSPCSTLSLSFLWYPSFFLLYSMHLLPFYLHIFLDRFTIKENREEESRLDAPFARQLRGRM